MDPILQGSVTRTLFHLAMPLVAGFLFIGTQVVVDAYFVASLGVEALAAVGFSGPIMGIVFSLLVGFGIGVDVCVARLVGAGRIEAVPRAVADALCWPPVSPS